MFASWCLHLQVHTHSASSRKQPRKGVVTPCWPCGRARRCPERCHPDLGPVHRGSVPHLAQVLCVSPRPQDEGPGAGDLCRPQAEHRACGRGLAEVSEVTRQQKGTSSPGPESWGRPQGHWLPVSGPSAACTGPRHMAGPVWGPRTRGRCCALLIGCRALDPSEERLLLQGNAQPLLLHSWNLPN